MWVSTGVERRHRGEDQKAQDVNRDRRLLGCLRLQAECQPPSTDTPSARGRVISGAFGSISALEVLRMLGIPLSQVGLRESLANCRTVAIYLFAGLLALSAACDRQSQREQEAEHQEKARELTARAHSVYSSTRDEALYARDTGILNDLLRDLHVYPEDGKLVIQFTVPPAPVRWALSWSSKPVLLVRLFDQNGQYLTHFKTKDAFCPNDDPRRVIPPEAAGLCRVLESFKGIYGFDAIQISEGLNRLAYPVNTRDLAYAEMVEVGFILSGDYK